MFPHLSEIARKHRDKGLKVIGISLEEPSSSLEQFVNGQGAKMDYTVLAQAVGFTCANTMRHPAGSIS